MKYKKISVKVNNVVSEIVSYAFIEQGSEGVSMIDGKEILNAISVKSDWDYYDKSLLDQDTDNVIIVGGFSEEYDENILSEQLQSYVGYSVELSVEICSDINWSEEWKKYYKPIVLGDIVVVFPWQKDDEIDCKHRVVIEPNMAFGTGSHETTSMCVSLLQKADVIGKEVVDIGCGSGILGICALRLGACKCVFVDNDDRAVDATKSNILLNDFECQEVFNGDLVANIHIMSDIIVANITADALIMLRKDIKMVIKDNGKVILSGIIADRLEDVKNAYQDEFRIISHISKNEWNALLLERNIK